MKKLKVGIIGLEFGATCHLPAFKKNNKCKLSHKKSPSKYAHT